MALLNRYPVLVSLFKDFRRSQVKTLALVVLAIMEVGFVRSMALAQHLAASLDVLPESALNRLYRLLRNPRFTNFQLTTALLRALADKGGELLIGFDWTEWVDGKRVLLGRSSPAPGAFLSRPPATFGTPSRARRMPSRTRSFSSCDKLCMKSVRRPRSWRTGVSAASVSSGCSRTLNSRS